MDDDSLRPRLPLPSWMAQHDFELLLSGLRREGRNDTAALLDHAYSEEPFHAPDRSPLARANELGLGAR